MLGLLGRAIALVAVASGVGFATNALRVDGVPLSAFAPPQSCQAPVGVQAVERLAPQQAASLCGDPHVLIADARSSQRFAEGHIAGAIHLPCAAPGTAADAAVTLLQGKHTLVVYGDSTNEAVPVAEELRRRIPPAVRAVVLRGGFAAWNDAGLACSSGACPDCKESAHP